MGTSLDTSAGSRPGEHLRLGLAVSVLSVAAQAPVFVAPLVAPRASWLEYLLVVAPLGGCIGIGLAITELRRVTADRMAAFRTLVMGSLALAGPYAYLLWIVFYTTFIDD